MRRRRRQTTAVILLSCVPLLGTSTGSHAQTDPIRPDVRQSSQQANVTVEFQGGSLSSFIAKLRSARKNVNIVASKMAEEVQLPALSIHNATIRSALTAVSRIVPPQYSATVDIESHPLGDSVYSIAVRPAMQQQMNAGGQRPTSVAVFSLRSLTEAPPEVPAGNHNMVMSATTALTAIDAGLSVTENRSPGARQVGKQTHSPTIRYHEDSNLLFVYGTIEQTNLVRETIDILERDLKQRRQDAVRKAIMEPPTKSK